MSRGINKVILVGFLGGEPDTKFTQGGTAVTKVSLATTSVRKDREGNQVETTSWHRVVFWGKTAEIAGEYLRKGSQIYVEGSIKYDKYTGQDGVERYTTEIVANELQMLGGRGDGEKQERPQRSQGGSRQAQGNSAPPPADDFDDESIPF